MQTGTGTICQKRYLRWEELAYKLLNQLFPMAAGTHC